MTLYENIKQLRLRKNMSQQELAELVGYKGKSMIARVEKGEIDLSESKIMEFAKALDVTPHKLMGWEDEEPDSDMVLIADYILNPNEDITTLMTIAGKLSEDNLHKVIDIAEALLLTQTDDKH